MARYLSRASGWQASLWRGAFALGCAALICGCTATGNQVEAENVKGGIQQLRRLSFVYDVPFISKSSDEARELMTAKLTRDNSDEELRIGGQVGAMTGLFPAGTDLRSKEIELMNHQIAGFYDPHDKVMVEVQGKSALGAAIAGRPQYAK